jgi:glycerate 2-kinase
MMRCAESLLLRELFDAAVAAADPARSMAAALPDPPRGRTIVVGAGKASAAMAAALEQHWRHPLEGVVVTRYGHSAPTATIEVLEAAHPVPDEAGQRAALRIAALTDGLTADDLVICLISGGGSALLALPVEGVSLGDLQVVGRGLLTSGATISDMNCVRKHLSQLQGGKLAARCAPARVVALLISDVPGDDPAIIASGPTVADPTTAADALAILERYAIELPTAVRRHLEQGCDETVKPGGPRLARVENRLIASPQVSLEAAAELARRRGITPLILGDSLEGEARDVGYVHAAIARQVVMHGQPIPRPCVLLSGGETTVTVRGQGRGGRNVEFLLGVVLALEGLADVHALACDTDGIDGTQDNAGAIATPDTLERARRLHLDARDHLARNDAYTFFAALDDLVMTGPTRTNVNDFRALLIR